MEPREEQALKEAYLDGQTYDKLIADLKMYARACNFNSQEDSIEELNYRFEYIDAQTIQEDYLKIIDLDKKYFGSIRSITRGIIDVFERDHKKLCYRVAGLKPLRKE